MATEETPGCPATEKTKEKEEQRQFVYVVTCRSSKPSDPAHKEVILHRAFVLEKDARRHINSLRECTQLIPEENLKWELYEFELH